MSSLSSMWKFRQTRLWPIPLTVIKTKHRHTSLIRQEIRFIFNMGAIGQHTVHTTERLAKLRELMTQHGVAAFVVPSEDQRMYRS